MIELEGILKEFEVKTCSGLGERRAFRIEFAGLVDKETAEKIIALFQEKGQAEPKRAKSKLTDFDSK